MRIRHKSVGHNISVIMCALLLSGMAGSGDSGRASAQEKPPLKVKGDAQEHRSGFLEDPFVTKYRKKFFAVFEGKTGEFEQGMTELDTMLAKNPRDARALVWHGNGLMVRSGIKRFAGQTAEARQLLVDSKKELDRAVALDPDNVNILAMRAVTLYIAGTYYPEKDLVPGNWECVIADLEKSRRIINPSRMKQLSVHARGQILSELATAYTHTGQPVKARELWREVQTVVPDSEFSRRAETELRKVDTASTVPAPAPPGSGDKK